MSSIMCFLMVTYLNAPCDLATGFGASFGAGFSTSLSAGFGAGCGLCTCAVTEGKQCLSTEHTLTVGSR